MIGCPFLTLDLLQPLDQFSGGIGVIKRSCVVLQPTGQMRFHMLVVDINEVSAVSVVVCASGNLGNPVCSLEQLGS